MKSIIAFFTITSICYSSSKITIVYPMESPNEIKLSKKLMKRAKEDFDIDITYIGVTNSELENKFLMMERAKMSADIVITQDITNISSYLEPVEEFKALYNFNKGALDYFTEGGKLVAIPVGLVTYGFVSNSVELNAPEDFFGKKTIIPNGTDRHSFRNFYLYCTLYGVDPLNTNDKNYSKVLSLYKNIVFGVNHYNDKYPDMYKAYANNEVDFIHSGVFHLGNQRPWGTENLRNTNAFSPGPYTYIGVSGVAISKNSKNKDNAKKIAKLYMEKDIISEKFLDMDLPAYDIDIDYSSLSIDEQRLKTQWIEISKNGIALPKIKNQIKVEKVFRENIVLFMEGKINESTFISNIKEYTNNN
ncbi:MAG: extracellular solute-binding protein [Fusobacteriaceae bacterium]